MSSLSSGQPFFIDIDVLEVPGRQDASNGTTQIKKDSSSLPVSPESVVASGTKHLASAASPWITSPVRRCIECIFAFVVMVTLFPLMVLIAAIIKTSSPGSVFFRQRRMGQQGNEFTLYKFRSMRVENEPGSPITVEGDSRITPVGAFLRRFKLDELPQFWNVVKGDMSLVGPRPKLPHHEGLHLPCRPGITGTATLAFRNEEKILVGIPENKLDHFYDQVIKPVKARMDLEYIESATLRSDLRMIVMTVASCTGAVTVTLSNQAPF